MINVFNFSGGRTSAYMVLKYYKKHDLVIFTDTGREHINTYKFIDDFENIEKIPIIKLKYNGGFENLIKNKKMLPNIMMRFCTIELKIKTARRYLRSINLNSYNNIIGFRHDEQNRINNYKEHWKKVKTLFPLNEEKISKIDILNFWNNKKYNLEIPSILSNCDLCFLKGKNNIISILRDYPELADKWIKDENLINATYIKNYSYSKMLYLSKLPYTKQLDLFNLTPSFNCSCTN